MDEGQQPLNHFLQEIVQQLEALNKELRQIRAILGRLQGQKTKPADSIDEPAGVS